MGVNLFHIGQLCVWPLTNKKLAAAQRHLRSTTG